MPQLDSINQNEHLIHTIKFLCEEYLSVLEHCRLSNQMLEETQEEAQKELAKLKSQQAELKS